MKFAPLGRPLKSTQMHFKTAYLVKEQGSYEAVKITHTVHLQWASGLTAATLNILNSQFMVNLHVCSPV